MTIPGTTTTYRYVADGGLLPALNRAGMARLRDPRLSVGVVLLGLPLVIVASLNANALTPGQPGKVLLVGAVSALVYVVLVVLVCAALVLPLVKLLNRRKVARLFPEGSVTEVELTPDILVINRPSRTRSVPYRAILRMRASDPFLRVERRDRLVAELLPVDLLPEDVVEFVRVRSRGAWPVTAAPRLETPDREMVVPAGWAAHVAAAHTRSVLSSTRTWVRFGLMLSVSALLAAVVGLWWLLVSPILFLLMVGVTYSMTRRGIASVLPTGSVVSTEFHQDGFTCRNRGGVREVRFQDLLSLEVRGDVVFLALAPGPPKIAIARGLISDDQLERLHRHAATKRAGLV